MNRPVLLDLYCGAGGAAVGYWRAGFDVLGVDVAPQPRYPFSLVRADALGFLAGADLDRLGIAAVHASPPCQHYTRSGGRIDHDRYPDLLPATRAALEATGRPWVLENVPGATMRADVVLCGSMFGLALRRHRWFELSDGRPRFAPLACDHSPRVVGVYGHPHGAAGANRGMLPGSAASWGEALGVDWMTAPELAEAIPPAYTEHVGAELLAMLDDG